MKQLSRSFRIKHAVRHYVMTKLAAVRLMSKEGSFIDRILGTLYAKIYNKQMAARKEAGIVEIGCYVEWGSSF